MPNLTGKEYFVRGCTALLDAVGGAIHHIGNVHKYARPEDRPERTLFVITTDGLENASRHYDYERVKAMIKRQKEKYGWEFIFLGANIDAVKEAARFGISADRAVRYQCDSAGTALNFGVISEAVTCARAAVPPSGKLEGPHRGGFQETGEEKMIGAILGDIIGSPYEFDRGNKTKDFPLFSKQSRFTDDSVMTLAVTRGFIDAGLGADDEAIRQSMVRSMRELAKHYPNAGYGGRFRWWLTAPGPQPYNSWGNGSAMRVSSAAWLFNDLDSVLRAATLSAEVTHNHPEGIKGAQATAAAIFLARTGHSKAEIKQYIEKTFGYDLSRTCDDIRPTYRHVESCQETVPEAITAFLEGEDFEDVIRTAFPWAAIVTLLLPSPGASLKVSTVFRRSWQRSALLVCQKIYGQSWRGFRTRKNNEKRRRRLEASPTCALPISAKYHANFARKIGCIFADVEV